MTPDEFRRNGYQMIDLIADYLETVEDHRIVPDIQPGDVRAMLPEHPPTEPESWDAVRADIDRVVLPGITHWTNLECTEYYERVAIAVRTCGRPEQVAGMATERPRPVEITPTRSCRAVSR